MQATFIFTTHNLSGVKKTKKLPALEGLKINSVVLATKKI